jgi:hypothetical protein
MKPTLKISVYARRMAKAEIKQRNASFEMPYTCTQVLTINAAEPALELFWGNPNGQFFT